jgi:hypothetical protein
MELSDQHKQQIRQWAAAGATLAEIQERLRKELDISLSYMETRLLVGELDVTLQEKAKAPEKADLDFAKGEVTAPAAPAPAAGKLSVTIDEIAPPNALVSGKVTFSDGVRADWYLDELGRLAINPTQPGYRPSQSDVTAFQRELQKLAQSRGL